jgi:thiol-disulfide isomerase/thioredoxin
VKTAVVAGALSLGLLLSACSSASDTLAEQYRSGSGQNYISGDGAITVVAPDSRKDPVSFGGELDTGGFFSPEDYAQSVTVVNFWYAGCPPCRLEAADLEAIYQEYREEGVVFVGVNIFDQAPTALAFASEFGVTYPSIMDVADGGVRLAFAGEVAPNAVPTTLVLDATGRVATRISGLLSEPDILRGMIDDLLSESR